MFIKPTSTYFALFLNNYYILSVEKTMFLTLKGQWLVFELK